MPTSVVTCTAVPSSVVTHCKRELVNCCFHLSQAEVTVKRYLYCAAGSSRGSYVRLGW